MKIDEALVNRLVANGDKLVAEKLIGELSRSEVPDLWRKLALLPRNYEDVCREWFLPTALGFLAAEVTWEL